MDTQFMAPRSGRMIKEDGTIINIADILAGDADSVGKAPINSYSAASGRMIREDGSVINIADEIANGNIGGGGATPEQIQQAVDAYLEENPVQPGATVEQVAQIEKNKTDISSVKEDVSSLSEDIGGLNEALNYVEPINLFNAEYTEVGFDYENGFLKNVSVDTETGDFTVGTGDRYLTCPINIESPCKIYYRASGGQHIGSIIGALEYYKNGTFKKFLNTDGLSGIDVDRGIIRLVVGSVPQLYTMVLKEEHLDEPYSKYFKPYYKELRKVTENSEKISKIEKNSSSTISLVECNYSKGFFNGNGTDVDTDYDSVRIIEPISTTENEILFIYIKNGYDLIINDISSSGVKRNMVFANHLSYITEDRKIRIGARKSDKSPITDDYSDVLKVYKLNLKNIHECYDICIAASDSPQIYKNKADVICDGLNDQFMLQCAMYNYRNSNKVLLYPGTYNITEIRDNPYSNNGLYGKKVIFNSQNPLRENVTNVIHVDGYMRHIVQQESILPVTIKFTEECWNSIDENGEQISVIGGEERNYYSRRLGIHMSCINFRGYDAKKPVVFVDGYYSANMQIEKVNVMSEAETFGAYTYIPNEKHNGFRGTQGSPYGTNYIKNSLAWKCGIGYNIGGEHFVLEDAGACFCGTGFAFSHYYGRIKMQHNHVMIKCVVSQCMKSIILDRYGLAEDSEDPLKASKQMLECIGLQLESSFTTSGLSEYGYEDGRHNTEGIYEIHNGTWFGTITLQTIAKAVSKGCKNMKVTIIMVPFAGKLSERPSISKVADYTEFYDVENNKKYIAYSGEWKLLN